jgi:hypothetical protein
MFIRFLFIAALSIQSLAFASAKFYVGSKSAEAKLEFTGSVKTESMSDPDEAALRAIIELQLKHMIAPMSRGGPSAAPKGDHQISDIEIISRENSLLTIGYKYKGTIVIENGPALTLPVTLPINPSKIYLASMVKKYNPCTNDTYQSEKDFWYFWNPGRSGCKIKKGIDYNIINAKLTRITNSKLTYPEYQNLPDQNGNINVHIFFGMDNPSNTRRVNSSDDYSALNYKSFKNHLIKNGYTATNWTDKEISAIAKTLDGEIPYVQTFKKNKMIYRLFFGATGINQDALAFHWFYKDALENASVVMYAGHSGFGRNLVLDSIEKNLGETISLSKKYQIYFFNGCNSYSYYNHEYFQRKVSDLDSTGTKALDILTNGLDTGADSIPAANIAIARALESKELVSYQSLARLIDSGNMFGVNGDEDNTLSLQK